MRIENEERPHFSVSQLVCYLQCPLQYYYQYVKGLAWKTTPSAVAFGACIHNTVEKVNRGLMEGKPISSTDATSKFINDWTENIQTDGISWKTPEESADMLVKGQELIELYCDEVKASRPTEVELQFRLPIIDPSTGLFIDSRDLVGKLDAIFDDDTVVEIKTTYRSPAQQETDINLQLTLYSWAYRMLYGKPEKGIKVVNLVKTKEPKVITVETRRVEREHSWLIATIAQVLRGIDLKLFYPNPIGGFGCFNCQYQAYCKEERDAHNDV